MALFSQTEMMLCMRAAPCIFRGTTVPGLSARPGAADVEQHLQRELDHTTSILMEAELIGGEVRALGSTDDPPRRLVDRLEAFSGDREGFLFLQHVLQETGAGRILAADARDGTSLEAKVAAVTRGVPQRAGEIVETLEEARGFARSRDLTSAAALVRLALERARELEHRTRDERASSAIARIQTLANALGDRRDQLSLFTGAIDAARVAIPAFEAASGERDINEDRGPDLGDGVAGLPWHLANAADREADPTVTKVGGALVDAFTAGGRPLTPAEVALLQPLYLDTVDYSRVEILRGKAGSADGIARTVGNRIYIAANEFVTDPSTGQPTDVLTPGGEDTLVHELGHVWQYQHAGLSYVPDALIAMAEATIMQGDRGAAYDWKAAAHAGVPLADLNPEQQAKCFEDFNAALRRIHAGKPWPDDPQIIALATPYVAEMQRSGPPPPKRKPPGVPL